MNGFVLHQLYRYLTPILVQNGKCILMHQERQLVLCCCNSIYLIQLFIQLSISLGNLLLHKRGIVPQIAKCWLLLRVSIIGMGILQVVLFVVIPAINHLSFFLVSPTLLDKNFDGQLSLWNSFLFSL